MCIRTYNVLLQIYHHTYTGMSQEVASKQVNTLSSPEQNTREVFGVSLNSYTSDPPLKLPSTKKSDTGVWY